MDIQQLKQFLAVADSGSFSGAAEKLYISRPAVSKSMSRLENETGTVLFERHSNGIVLTDAGNAILPKIRELVSAYDALNEDIMELGTGRQPLHIGFTYGIHSVFLDALSAFELHHPEYAIDITDCSFENMPQLLQSGKLDLGCTGANYQDPDLISMIIRRCEVFWGVKDDSNIAERGHILDEEIHSMPHCIPKGSNMETILKVCDNGAVEIDDDPYQNIFDDNMFYLCKLVERSKGILPIGKDAIPQPIKGITFLPCLESPRYWEIHAFVPKQKRKKALQLLLKEVFTPL